MGYIRPRYAYNDSKMKAIRKHNQSAELNKQEANEYGYNLPKIVNSKFPTFRSI